MHLTMQQKKALYWGLGIVIAAVLMSMAWGQINATLARCFSVF
jgi:uncharacterized membrane protein (DUF441 family)